MTPAPTVQYTAICYTNRLLDAGAVASIGSVGDSYDNAQAETLIGLYKTELVRPEGPWRGVDDLELATSDWVHWFNHSGAQPARACAAGGVRGRVPRPPHDQENPRDAVA